MKRTSTVSTNGSKDSEEPSKPELQTQILSNPYINFERLEQLLKSKFGSNWKVQVKLGRVILAVPDLLQTAELEALEE